MVEVINGRTRIHSPVQKALLVNVYVPEVLWSSTLNGRLSGAWVKRPSRKVRDSVYTTSDHSRCTGRRITLPINKV
jgi:hypothetical protein